MKRRSSNSLGAEEMGKWDRLRLDGGGGLDKNARNRGIGETEDGKNGIKEPERPELGGRK